MKFNLPDPSLGRQPSREVKRNNKSLILYGVPDATVRLQANLINQLRGLWKWVFRVDFLDDEVSQR